MITMEEARERVDRRLGVLAPNGRAVVRDVALACPGTDVRGPELEAEIDACRLEFARAVAGGAQVGAALNGLVFRTFWLGYECGRAVE